MVGLAASSWRPKTQLSNQILARASAAVGDFRCRRRHVHSRRSSNDHRHVAGHLLSLVPTASPTWAPAPVAPCHTRRPFWPLYWPITSRTAAHREEGSRRILPPSRSRPTSIKALPYWRDWRWRCVLAAFGGGRIPAAAIHLPAVQIDLAGDASDNGARAAANGHDHHLRRNRSVGRTMTGLCEVAFGLAVEAGYSVWAAASRRFFWGPSLDP